MATQSSDLLKWLPVAVVAAGLVGTGYVTLERQAAFAGELEDQSASIDDIEHDIALIQRQLIQRQGEVELRTQRIELQQEVHGKTLEEILLLLKEMQREALSGQ